MTREEILEKINNYNNKIQEKLNSFITGCYSLEEVSKKEYQVQKTVELNRIYLQGYVLDSKLCKYFQEKGIANYSLEFLKDYINKNFNPLDEDYSIYYLALSLYEEALEIEELIDGKVKLEMDFLSNYIPQIKSLDKVGRNDLLKEYEILKEILMKRLKDKFREEDSRMIILILNDIINYFLNGYPKMENN